MIKFENVNYIYSPKTPNEFHALKDINLERKVMVKNKYDPCVNGL